MTQRKRTRAAKAPAAIAGLAVWIGAATAFAQSLPPAGAQTCWGRVYTEAHMQANPDQTVREMRLTIDNRAGDGFIGFVLVAAMRGEWAQYWQTDGGCEQPAGAARPSCYVACDGGGFAVETEAGGDSLLLFNNGFVLTACGSDIEDDAENDVENEDAFRFLDPTPADQVFRLYRLRAEFCGG